MSYRPSYERGNWKADCEVCGRTFKASLLRLRWDNLMVCPDDWEPRHPQDFVRGKIDKQLPPWTRDETEVWPLITPPSIAMLAIAGVAIAGTKYGPGAVPSGTFTY